MTEQGKSQPEQKSLTRIGLEALTIGMAGLAALATIGPLVIFPITGIACEIGGGIAGAYAMGLTSVAFFAVPAGISFTRNAHRNK